MKIDQLIQEVTTSLIAIVLVAGTVAIVAYQAVNGKPFSVPDVLVALDFAVGGLYFGNVSAKNGARQAGTAAAQTAIANTQPSGGNTGNVASSPPAV